MGTSKPGQKIIFSADVACAVIVRRGKILISRRRKKDYLGGFWEFPGGKRVGGESLGQCLQREIFEELAVRVVLHRYLGRIDHRYPDRAVSLYFYQCELVEGEPWARGSAEIRWVRPFELKRYKFPPADESILKALTSLR